MRWKWKFVMLHQKYAQGDHGKPNVTLEAVSSQELHICHYFFRDTKFKQQYQYQCVTPVNYLKQYYVMANS